MRKKTGYHFKEENENVENGENSVEQKPQRAAVNSGRESVVAEMDELLSELNRHVRYLRDVNRKLRKIDADVDKMDKYYRTDWMDDYEHFESKIHYDVLSQDPVYDAFQEIYIEKMKLLKRIASKLQ